MIPQQYETLLSKLELATANISGLWKKTSDRNKFSVSINSITILISIYTSFPEELDSISFEIMNAGGEVIDGIYLDATEQNFDRLKNLYDSAKRNALMIPETLSSVVSGLDDLLANNANGKRNNEIDELPF